VPQARDKEDGEGAGLAKFAIRGRRDGDAVSERGRWRRCWNKQYRWFSFFYRYKVFWPSCWSCPYSFPNPSPNLSYFVFPSPWRQPYIAASTVADETDARCRTAGADKASNDRHRGSETGESAPPSRVGRIDARWMDATATPMTEAPSSRLRFGLRHLPCSLRARWRCCARLKNLCEPACSYDRAVDGEESCPRLRRARNLLAAIFRGTAERFLLRPSPPSGEQNFATRNRRERCSH
jgi:hypothetical protein